LRRGPSRARDRSTERRPGWRLDVAQHCPTIEGMELDQLSAFVGSEARARLLAHFVARPESRLHVRALERDTGIGKRSLQKELARLVAMGLVRREHQGRRPSCPVIRPCTKFPST